MGEVMSVNNLTKREPKKKLKQHQKRTKAALAGNRTPLSRVAGENSSTEAPIPCLHVIYR